MLAGDKGEANLGLEHAIWQRLAHTVDPAALVNHVLPYSQLFGPNVVGTAELIRIALTTRIKPYVYVSTIGVGDGIASGTFVEETDIRQMSATRTVGDNYANGYGNSKWGGEGYHVVNPYDDGISMDTFVDWLVEAGYPIARVRGAGGEDRARQGHPPPHQAGDRQVRHRPGVARPALSVTHDAETAGRSRATTIL